MRLASAGSVVNCRYRDRLPFCAAGATKSVRGKSVSVERAGSLKLGKVVDANQLAARIDLVAQGSRRPARWGRFSLVTFFGGAKKVTSRRATPGIPSTVR